MDGLIFVWHENLHPPPSPGRPVQQLLYKLTARIPFNIMLNSASIDSESGRYQCCYETRTLDNDEGNLKKKHDVRSFSISLFY